MCMYLASMRMEASGGRADGYDCAPDPEGSMLRPLAIALAACACLSLPGCGEDETPPASPGEAPPDWSAPQGEAPATNGTRDLTGTVSAKTLLARLHQQVVAGRALSGASWQQDLESLADLLWPPTNEEGVPAAVTAHMRLMQVAGDVGRALARDPEERQRWEARHPEDVQIYEQFVATSKRGPTSYRDWVAGTGRQLLRAKAQRLQKMFEKR